MVNAKIVYNRIIKNSNWYISSVWSFFKFASLCSGESKYF